VNQYQYGIGTCFSARKVFVQPNGFAVLDVVFVAQQSIQARLIYATLKPNSNNPGIAFQALSFRGIAFHNASTLQQLSLSSLLNISGSIGFETVVLAAVFEYIDPFHEGYLCPDFGTDFSSGAATCPTRIATIPNARIFTNPRNAVFLDTASITPTNTSVSSTSFSQALVHPNATMSCLFSLDAAVTANPFQVGCTFALNNFRIVNVSDSIGFVFAGLRARISASYDFTTKGFSFPGIELNATISQDFFQTTLTAGRHLTNTTGIFYPEYTVYGIDGPLSKRQSQGVSGSSTVLLTGPDVSQLLAPSDNGSSSDNTVLIAGICAGVAAFIIVIVAGVIVWKFRRILPNCVKSADL